MTALRKKYGAGATGVVEALQALRAADAKRGIDTIVVGLDDKSALENAGGKPVKSAKSAPQAKAAIDALYASVMPDYLMLLGGTDVIPHVSMANPALAIRSDDPDARVASDLPYASEDRYGTSPTGFTRPTRVLGRLPDSMGATDPAPLITLLKHAASGVSRPPKEFAPLFAVSASVWGGSSAKSVAAITGKAGNARLVLPDKTGWKATLLRSRMQFFNCHGGTADARFYGEGKYPLPIALTSNELVGKIRAGTIIGAECCYGAELYRHALANGVPPICERYLAEGAAGFFGSTCVAYGAEEDSTYADCIVQHFLKRVLAGASIGMAALEAQQQFVADRIVLDPLDLKTLAQFLLLGDPSLRPVTPPSAPKDLFASFNASALAAHSHGMHGSVAFDAALRRIRRDLAVRQGRAATNVPVVEQVESPKVPSRVRDALKSATHGASLTGIERTTFATRLDGSTLRIHYASGCSPAKPGKPRPPGVVSIVIVRVVELDGEVLAVQRITSK